MKTYLFLCITFFMAAIHTIEAQEITDQLYTTYEKYKENTLDHRRIKHHRIQPLINAFVEDKRFTVKKVGESIEGRDLKLISLGSGKTSVFLWSQMHGDEPTATQAIFDILNFFKSDDYQNEKKTILDNLTLHFLPMLNPDGAEKYERRNALGIDINRDALRLQSPEGQTLKKVRDSLSADFGFNLHDQSTYYNAELTSKPATISYLATAFNYEKDINEVRANAMKVIVFMNKIIQEYAPGQVGRYNDDFEPRAFGDNIAKWGTSLILIESGGYQNDVEKQKIRKLNYVSILSALHTIATKSYESIAVEAYEEIPHNDRKLFDLKIENVTYNLNGNDYILDLGINRNEVDDSVPYGFHYNSTVVDQGDLSTYYGYNTFDATGYTIVAPKTTQNVIVSNSKEKAGFHILNSEQFLKLGRAYLRIEALSDQIKYSSSPMHLVHKNFKAQKVFELKPGINATFFLAKEGVITHAVINGFLLDVNKPLENQMFINALVYRE